MQPSGEDIKNAGDGIDKAADGVSKVIKVGERNRWAFVLIIALGLIIHLLMDNANLRNRLFDTQNEYLKNQKDLLLMSRDIKQLVDTPKITK